MTRRLLFALLVGLVGCRNSPPRNLSVTHHTHKVWLSPDFLLYETDDGFGCGHIERSTSGWTYTARTINWNDISRHPFEPSTIWNNFEDAEKWLEQWCKP